MENLRGSAQRAAAATAVTTSVETRVAVCTCAPVASQVQCGNGEHRFVVVCSPDQIVLPKRDSMVGDGEVRISLTEDCVQEFGNWLLRCGIDRVEVGFSDNHPFDPTEVCHLFGIPISPRAATDPGKKEENTKPSTTTTPASSYLLQQAAVGP